MVTTYRYSSSSSPLHCIALKRSSPPTDRVINCMEYLKNTYPRQWEELNEGPFPTLIMCHKDITSDNQGPHDRC
ncbi:hypothetical protein K443DRAFT_369017 [Laccaria amethystina LaAM-08-1]|uniref:Unplaced genomic scaffold K443scaffold_272, whole genome shotgun sequence n=1 Tax=Laccaria amethystina LaAM-08-1 TaxID=1095629 RepID=A0A0C9WYT4_9AGAR|nr:hypothetical protein K443DRAFT_369017 [Laccaria amethystina LaAM-08-1]